MFDSIINFLRADPDFTYYCLQSMPMPVPTPPATFFPSLSSLQLLPGIYCKSGNCNEGSPREGAIRCPWAGMLMLFETRLQLLLVQALLSFLQIFSELQFESLFDASM